MVINTKEMILRNCNIHDQVMLPNVSVARENIKVIMINEVPVLDTDYAKTILPLFRNAGVAAGNSSGLVDMGIYITSAIKIPKTGYAVDPSVITAHLPILEYELDMFDNVKVIMLMGDVAKKAFNMISKKRTKKNVIPSGSTYRIRTDEFYYGDIRVFPSYIMTGGNILIEKSKCAMITDDITRMMKCI